MLPIVHLSVRFGLLAKEDRLMQLIICLESATTTAQMVIVALNQLERPVVAAQVVLLAPTAHILLLHASLCLSLVVAAQVIYERRFLRFALFIFLLNDSRLFFPHQSPQTSYT